MIKQALIHALTGRMGSGKTSLADKVSHHYDEIFQTDMPRPMNKETGQYDEPTKAEKERIRRMRRDSILAADRAGKKVLLEGHPPGIVKLMRDDLPKVDRVFLLPTNRKQSFRRVAMRALRDPEYDLETDMESARANNDLFEEYLRRIRKVHHVEETTPAQYVEASEEKAEWSRKDKEKTAGVLPAVVTGLLGSAYAAKRIQDRNDAAWKAKHFSKAYEENIPKELKPAGPLARF